MQDTDKTAYVDYLQAGDVVLGWEFIHPDDNSVSAVSFQEETADKLKADDLKEHFIRVKIGDNDIVFIADTGSPTSFVKNNTAATLQNTVTNTRRILLNQDDAANRMVCYNGYKIPTLGTLITPIESGVWTINTAPYIVVDNKRANILGRNRLPQLGIHLHQEKPTGKSINYIDQLGQINIPGVVYTHRTFKKPHGSHKVSERFQGAKTKRTQNSDTYSEKSRTRNQIFN